MKRSIYSALLIPVIVLFFTACKKDKGSKPVIDDNNLTACPIGKQCQNLFTEQADLGVQGNLIGGNYRLFWHTEDQPGINTSFHIKAPMQGDNFVLNKADIINGKVVYQAQCPACSMVPLKVVDGSVKGVNTTPNKRADQSRWLIEAKIVLQAVGAENTLKDTTYFKQYFTPNFIYN